MVRDLDDATMLCRCEGITVGALREAAVEKDAREVNRAKAFTRAGMGRCQGRMCGRAAAEVLAAARGDALEQAGRLRAQPPVKPIPMLPELLS
jgi:bacterioferritin-associated ferredoxin